MVHDEIKATGLDQDLKNHLRSWGIEQFTHVQKAALEAGAADAKSMVVCAPTSGGKKRPDVLRYQTVGRSAAPQAKSVMRGLCYREIFSGFKEFRSSGATGTLV